MRDGDRKARSSDMDALEHTRIPQLPKHRPRAHAIEPAEVGDVGRAHLALLEVIFELLRDRAQVVNLLPRLVGLLGDTSISIDDSPLW